MKVVEFCISGEVTLKLDVMSNLALSTLILKIQIKKLLNKGVQGYLTFLINISADKVKIEDVPVAKEYPEIFSNELVSLSLEREK